jgi:hypothetical protein
VHRQEEQEEDELLMMRDTVHRQEEQEEDELLMMRDTVHRQTGADEAGGDADVDEDLSEARALKIALERLIGDVGSHATDEARDAAPRVIEHIRDRALRGERGVLLRTADRLDAAVALGRASRHAIAWGGTAVNAVRLGASLRRFDELMRESREAPNTVTMRQAAEELGTLGDSTAEFLGSEAVPLPTSLTLALQAMVRAATQLGRVLAHQLARHLDAATEGGQSEHLSNRGANAEYQGAEQTSRLRSAAGGEWLDTFNSQPAALNAISVKIGSLSEKIAQAITSSQEELGTWHTQHDAYYYGHDVTMRNNLADLRESLVDLAYERIDNHIATNMLNVILIDANSQADLVALHPRGGGTSIPAMLVRTGDSMEIVRWLARRSVSRHGLLPASLAALLH